MAAFAGLTHPRTHALAGASVGACELKKEPVRSAFFASGGLFENVPIRTG